MRIGLIKNGTFIKALAISVILFNGHKIAGRFGSLPNVEIGDWAKEFPGLIFTHQPFETMEIAIATISFYLLTTGFYFYLVVKILSNPRLKEYAPWLFAFIFAWGGHEIHHITSDYPNGKTFALWFTISTLVVLPAMLTWNGLVALLNKSVIENVPGKVFGGPAFMRNPVGYRHSIAPIINEPLNYYTSFENSGLKMKGAQAPMVTAKTFYKIE